ncbi:cytochrome P450 4X1-like [Sycon ciliatum]|uniref:cytochrome P450 4X1-like n=1 Tax=Sycon ciliatum TaxID=27933 RepID=UPI0031F697B4
MLAFLIATAIIASAVYSLMKMLLVMHKIEKFAGPTRRWLVNLHQFGPGRVDSVLALTRQFQGKIFRVYVAPWSPWLIASDPAHQKQILKGTEPKLEDAYYTMGPWLGEGLLLASGKKWVRNRRLLTPAFHFEILKPYLGIANSTSDVLVDVMSQHAGEDGYFNIMPYISRATLDVLLQCSMSAQTNCQTDATDHPYVEAVEEVSVLTMDRTMNALYRYAFIYDMTPSGRKFAKALKIMHGMSSKIIAERRNVLSTGSDQARKSKYLDFLDILLTAKDEGGNGMSDKEIRDEVDTFMFEGHDTTAHGIGWTLHCLGLNPDHQQKCRDEIDELLSGGNQELEWDDMGKLRYTHQCIREAMRIFPPVPVTGRVLTADTEIEGKVAPAGTGVIMNIVGLHRNPDVWDNPMEFRPSRFTDDEMKKRDPFAYVPFSAGPRNCIGQIFASHEMKITVAKILREYYIETDPDHELKLRFALVLRPMTGLMVRLRKRTEI